MPIKQPFKTKAFYLFKWLFVPICILYAFISHIESAELPPIIHSSFKQDCQDKGIKFEEYAVTTDDGYILSLYRIPGSGPPVLLVHGLSNSANCFILNQCSKPPAFFLSDSGYDVWLGNMRGSHLSRGHTHLNSSNDDYWDWTMVELIRYDLISFIKFIKSQTDYKKVALLGHSQGGSVILWALAQHPDLYAPHVNIGILIGTPGAYINTQSMYIKLLLSDVFHFFSKIFSVNVISDWTDDLFLAKFIIRWPRIAKWLCQDMLDIDFNKGTIEDLSIYIHRMRGGTSFKNIEFWTHIVNAKEKNPLMYDYGNEGNLKRYNSTVPPRIDFSKVETNIAYFGGELDFAVIQSDSRILRDSLNPEIVVFYNDTYHEDHGGFVFGCTMSYYNDLLEVLGKYSNKVSNYLS